MCHGVDQMPPTVPRANWAAERPESAPVAAQIRTWTEGRPERLGWSAALELAFEEHVAVAASGRPFDL